MDSLTNRTGEPVSHSPDIPVLDETVDQDRLIRVMPESLANKIAAGEVVQRPSSVVKELVENAIDAGAGAITIHVSGAGSDLVQVVDDGCGMGPEDARACFGRHATSKIREIEDLETIRTLGFRGEALASIAAVSHVTLRTRRHADDTGVELVLEGGELVSEQPAPAVVGTTITVRNLFFNVPARRKFLKRPATELKHIVDIVESVALANPRLSLRLLHGDNDLLRLRSSGASNDMDALRKRIEAVLSLDDREPLIPVVESTSYLSVSGFLGRPDHHRRSRGRQHLFVNGRPIRDRSLEHAVFSAYEYLLPEGAHPVFVLFLDIDPRHVDVNVHPAKSEVKFDDERGVYGMLRTIVRRAVGTSEKLPQFGDALPLAGLDLGGFDSAETSQGSVVSETQRPFGSTGAGERGLEAGPMDRGPGRRPGDLGAASELFYGSHFLGSSAARGVPAGSAIHEGHEEREAGSEDLLWQLHDAYVLTQIRSGLVIVDQQAAHERILYEQARNALSGGIGLSQQLLFPTTVELSASDLTLFGDLSADLRSLGFDVEHFGGRTLVVRGVPADIHAGDERHLLEEVIDQYRRFERAESLSGRENLARCIATKSAVRPGTRLSRKEMRALIDKLFQCSMPWVSPGGRPTIVKLSVDELRERFERRPG